MTNDGWSRTTKSRKIRRKGKVKYLRILEEEIKEKINEYLKRTRKLLEIKLQSKNLIKGINTKTVPLVRHPVPFLKWTKGELQQIDHRTRTIMTKHMALLSVCNISMVYVSRKKKEWCIHTMTQSLHKRCKRRLITETRKIQKITVSTDKK